MKKPFVRWGQYLGPSGKPFMRRWVINFGLFTLRIHHWLDSDDERTLHDHPWWFFTYILKGGYLEMLTYYTTPMEKGDYVFRSATHKHRVVDIEKPCWTFVVTGRMKRKWGFWDDEGNFTEAPDQDYT